jgi:hypothetical protein
MRFATDTGILRHSHVAVNRWITELLPESNLFLKWGLMRA